MSDLTHFEFTAMQRIISETPDHAPALARQLGCAHVVSRENSGGGFFTTLGVDDGAPPVSTRSVLGYVTRAHVKGLEHGLGFVLFMKDGRLALLEGYAFAEDTSSPDLENLTYEIYQCPEGEGHPPSPF